MPVLQRLRADHAPAVLAFERENRAYFARAVGDRGDDFFARFDQRHASLLAEQAEGVGAYYVLVDDEGAVVGRFNLVLDGPVAELGYRVAQRVAGRGLASTAVSELCARAAAELGVEVVRAATTDDNAASRRVLQRAGFVVVGPAGPEEVGGGTGTRWERAAQAPPAVSPDP
jgi:ribosomal-protein-alanine N-acetyltransferase